VASPAVARRVTFPAQMVAERGAALRSAMAPGCAKTAVASPRTLTHVAGSRVGGSPNHAARVADARAPEALDATAPAAAPVPAAMHRSYDQGGSTSYRRQPPQAPPLPKWPPQPAEAPFQPPQPPEPPQQRWHRQQHRRHRLQQGYQSPPKTPLRSSGALPPTFATWDAGACFADDPTWWHMHQHASACTADYPQTCRWRKLCAFMLRLATLFVSLALAVVAFLTFVQWCWPTTTSRAGDGDQLCKCNGLSSPLPPLAPTPTISSRCDLVWPSQDWSEEPWRRWWEQDDEGAVSMRTA